MEAAHVGEGAPVPAIYSLHAAFGEALAREAVQVGLPAAPCIPLKTGYSCLFMRNKDIPHLMPHFKICLRNCGT